MANLFQQRPECSFVRSVTAASSSSLSRESLETIVDGAVCTLARRSHRFRQFNRHSSSSLSSSRQKDAVIVNHRRRRRRKAKATTGANRDFIFSNYPANAAIGRDNHSEKPHPSSFSSTRGDNHWLLEENLLSAGYSLGSGGDHRTTHPQRIDDDDDGNDDNKRQRPRQSLRGCPNMAPGIHCLHPNRLTSYARSSPFMR